MNCRSCGAPIFFVRTKNGKCMPCDKQPVYCTPKKDGSLTVVTAMGDVVKADLMKPGDRNGFVGYHPHWASCPGANKWRKA